MSHLLIQADARRIPLANESVHCIVTSPPYWGLRDYGTATWEGGDPDCEHKNGRAVLAATTVTGGMPHLGSEGIQRDLCRKCGARRIDAQIGLEASPEAYVASMVTVFREVWRVLRNDGCAWVNLGDSYATGAGRAFNTGGGETSIPQPGVPGYRGMNTKNPKWAKSLDPICQPNRMPIPGLKPKDLIGIPWRVALALQADGWFLRSDIIWAKVNPMPESVTDRPTKSHEYLFLLTKQEQYYFDQDAVREPHCDEVSKSTAFLDRAKYDHSLGVSYAAIGKVRGHDNNAHCHPAGRNIRSVWQAESDPAIDVYADGMRRITSEDCPVHGCQASQAPVRLDGEQRDASRSGHNRHTDDDLSLEPRASDVAIPVDPSLSLSGASSATSRSTRTRKTGASSKHGATSDDRQASRTEYKESLPHSDAMCNHTPGCNTSEDGVSDEKQPGLLEQTLSHNEDSSACAVLSVKCTCNYIDSRPKDKTSSRVFPSVLSIPTEAYAGSHFAVFPRKLVEPCIKAGTSERGACPTCSAPWERVTDGVKYQPEVVAHGDRFVDASRGDKVRKLNGKSPAWVEAATSRSTLGFRPTCSCPAADPVPCVVLDPFAGSGTTLVVAEALGRVGIGLDLSGDYLAQAKRRIERPHQPLTKQREQAMPLFAHMEDTP